MVALFFLLVGLDISGAGSVPTTEWSPETTEVDHLPTVQEAATTEDDAWTSTESAGERPTGDRVFSLRDRADRECLLAEFRATFSILYDNRLGHQNVTVHLPERSRVEGACAGGGRDPLLRISWTKFSYRLLFSKLDRSEFWGVQSMELTYDSSGPLFDDAFAAGNKSAKFLDDKTWLQVPLNKSYYCPSPEILYLYNNKKEKKVMVTLRDVRIQPYGVVNGKFSEANECHRQKEEGHRQIENRDETLPMAVGSTLAVLTLIGVSGYAIYRTITARRVDYSTME